MFDGSKKAHLVLVEKTYVFYCEEFCFLVFGFGCGGVLARSHCVEEGTDDELTDGLTLF